MVDEDAAERWIISDGVELELGNEGGSAACVSRRESRKRGSKGSGARFKGRGRAWSGREQEKGWSSVAAGNHSFDGGSYRGRRGSARRRDYGCHYGNEEGSEERKGACGGIQRGRGSQRGKEGEELEVEDVADRWARASVRERERGEGWNRLGVGAGLAGPHRREREREFGPGWKEEREKARDVFLYFFRFGCYKFWISGTYCHLRSRNSLRST